MPLLGCCGLYRYFPSTLLQSNCLFQLLFFFPSSLNYSHQQILPRSTDICTLFSYGEKLGKGDFSYLAWDLTTCGKGEWKLLNRKFEHIARDRESATFSRRDAILKRGQKRWKGEKKHSTQTIKDEARLLPGMQWHMFLRYTSKIMMKRPFLTMCTKSSAQTANNSPSERIQHETCKQSKWGIREEKTTTFIFCLSWSCRDFHDIFSRHLECVHCWSPKPAPQRKQKGCLCEQWWQWRWLLCFLPRSNLESLCLINHHQRTARRYPTHWE